MSDAQRHAKQAKREREARGVEAVSAAALYWWETLRIYTDLIERHPNCPP